MATKKPPAWRNRIVEQRMVPIAELRENPANFRRHPAHQGGALSQVLDEVGLVQGCVLNRRSEALGWPPGEVPTLVDGHLRVELARKRKEASLPVTVVDLSPDEERLVLATLDPLGALAETDVEALAGLIGELPDFTADLGDLLAELAGKKPGDDAGEDPGPQMDRAAELQEKWGTERGQIWAIPSKTAPAQVTCPHCQHKQRA